MDIWCAVHCRPFDWRIRYRNNQHKMVTSRILLFNCAYSILMAWCLCVLPVVCVVTNQTHHFLPATCWFTCWSGVCSVWPIKANLFLPIILHAPRIGEMMRRCSWNQPNQTKHLNHHHHHHHHTSWDNCRYSAFNWLWWLWRFLHCTVSSLDKMALVDNIQLIFLLCVGGVSVDSECFASMLCHTFHNWNFALCMRIIIR